VVQAVQCVSICFAAGRRVVVFDRIVFDRIVISGGFCSSAASVIRLSLQQEKRIGSLISGSLNNNNNNNNNIYLLQLGCHPVAVVILHVNKA